MEQNFDQQNEVEEVNVSTNRCTACGSQLKFDIETGALVCRHCKTSQSIDADDTVWRRELTDEIMRTRTKRQEGTVARCQGCGASEVLDRTAINKICHFCGSTSIVDTEDLCGIQPDSIIPFTVDKNRAHSLFGKWIKSRSFAPSIFKQTDVREKMNAIYIPSWSFSSNADGIYNGVLGRRVTRQVRGRNGQWHTTTTIRYFRVNGLIRRGYTDFLVQSSKSISPINFNNLNPFTLNETKAYRQEFLTGIPTEHYSKDVEECFQEFTTRVKQDLRKDIVRRHRADMVQSLSLNLGFNQKRFNYILLPLYIANYKYKNKTYNFYVNGTSGKIVGKYPISKFKIGAIIFGVFAILAAAVLIYHFL